MKRYKLIKDYPGSPNLGAISNSPDCENYPEFWKEIQKLKCGQLVYRIWNNGKKSLGVLGTYSNKNKFATHFKALEGFNECGGVIKGDVYGIGNYEYEIVEKDYEILSFQSKINNAVVVKNMFTGDVSKKSNWIIHSVKKLSDGEIFTIGDKIKAATLEDAGLITQIDLLDYVTILIGTKSVRGPLKNMQKIEHVLFTTEDGVEEYILMNKPCLNINDVCNLGIAKDGSWVTSLKKLVKLNYTNGDT